MKVKLLSRNTGELLALRGSVACARRYEANLSDHRIIIQVVLLK